MVNTKIVRKRVAEIRDKYNSQFNPQEKQDLDKAYRYGFITKLLDENNDLKPFILEDLKEELSKE